MKEKKKCIQGLVETPERKGTLGRPRYRWGNSKKAFLRKRMGGH